MLIARALTIIALFLSTAAKADDCIKYIKKEFPRSFLENDSRCFCESTLDAFKILDKSWKNRMEVKAVCNITIEAGDRTDQIDADVYLKGNEVIVGDIEVNEFGVFINSKTVNGYLEDNDKYWKILKIPVSREEASKGMTCLSAKASIRITSLIVKGGHGEGTGKVITEYFPIKLSPYLKCKK